MATHSSVLAWRIPGMGEPGGLLSMGSHKLGHNWSDLAAGAAYSTGNYIQYFAITYKEKYYLTLTSDHLVEMTTDLSCTSFWNLNGLTPGEVATLMEVPVISSCWGLHGLWPMVTTVNIRSQRWGWERGSLLLQGQNLATGWPWPWLWSSAGHSPQSVPILPAHLAAPWPEDPREKAMICLSPHSAPGPLPGRQSWAGPLICTKDSTLSITCW